MDKTAPQPPADSRLFIATFRFHSLRTGEHGEFCFAARASSQEELELKVYEFLRRSDIVKSMVRDKWFPRPCSFSLARLAVADSFPSGHGGILHFRRRNCADEFFPPLDPNAGGFQVIHDLAPCEWWEGSPAGPLFEISHEGNVTVCMRARDV